MVRVSSTPDLHKGAPLPALTEKKTRPAAATTTAASPPVTSVVATSSTTASSTSSATRKASPPASSAIEYDPNRTAHIALLCYADGERRYIIAPKGLKAGDQLIAGRDAPIKVGNTLPLRNIPIGSTVHCIEMKPGKGAQIARSPAPGAAGRPRRVTPRCACAPAKCARCRPTAAPPSAKSATTSTTSRSSARPAPSAGAASSRPCAAPP